MRLPSCLDGFSGNLWIRISQCTTEFLVSVCNVATFRYVTCCSYNCSFRQVGDLPEIFPRVWTDNLSKSSNTTSVIKYEFTSITLHCCTKYSTKPLLTTAHCACIRPHSFPTLLKTLLQPLQASSKLLLLAKTTHSLLTALQEVEGR